MKKSVCSLDAVMLAHKFAVDELPYDEIQFVTFHETNESFHFEYEAIDYHSRKVKLSVYLNCFTNELTAGVVLAKGQLEDYMQYAQWTKQSK